VTASPRVLAHLQRINADPRVRQKSIRGQRLFYATHVIRRVVPSPIRGRERPDEVRKKIADSIIAKRGTSTVFLGKPCIRCGLSLRYRTPCHPCVHCLLKRQRATRNRRLAPHPFHHGSHCHACMIEYARRRLAAGWHRR